jgi:hypothetical protein
MGVEAGGFMFDAGRLVVAGALQSAGWSTKPMP